MLIVSLIPSMVCDYNCIARSDCESLRLWHFTSGTISCCLSPFLCSDYTAQPVCISRYESWDSGWHAENQGCDIFLYMRGWSIASPPEGTIGSVCILVFDTVVIAMTLHHMLETWRLQRALKGLEKRSMTRLMLQQGELCLCVLIMSRKFQLELGILYYLCVTDIYISWCSVLTIIKFRFVLIFGVFVLSTNEARPCAIFALIPWPPDHLYIGLKGDISAA